MIDLKNALWVSLAALALIFAACSKDDPEPNPSLPTASFTVAVTDLTAAFTNTSTNATSYEWSFGDGNSSADQSPSHTYTAAGDYEVTLKATNADGSTSKMEMVTVTEPERFKTSGYWITSALNTSAGWTEYGGYVEELPTGDVDMTQFTSFTRQRIRASHGKYLYMSDPQGSRLGLVKMGIDRENGTLVEEGYLPVINGANRTIIMNDELGFYTNFRDLKVYAFNPTTMEDIQAIDIEPFATALPKLERTGVTGIFHNEKTGKLIATLYVDGDAAGTFYDDTSIHAVIIDVATLTAEKGITHPEAIYPLFRGESNTIVDTDGNLYILAHGSYGLDGQIGPNAAVGSRPRLTRITPNGEFDMDYTWNPVNEFGFENNFFQLLVSMVQGEDNKAYAIITGGQEGPDILALLGKLGAGTITSAEYDQLRLLIFGSEKQKIVEIDLVNKTVTEVGGMPATAGFAYPYMYNFDGKVYTQMISNGGTFNGHYVIDPATNTGAPQFNISQGGFAQQIIKLGE